MLQGIHADIRAIYNSGTHIETGSYYNTAFGTFILKESSCAGVTRAVGLCLYILGIPYVHVNENQWAHQWNRVYIESHNAYLNIDAQGGIFSFSDDWFPPW